VYDFTVLAEESLYWATGGENFTDGVYEVEATAVDGTLNNGFGMMFRYDEETDSFYLFEVSSDGYVWIGLCQNGCSEVDAVVEGGWFQSDAVNLGLDATNFLRVEAKGSNLAFYVNGIEVGRMNDSTLTGGDIGLLVETFDEGGVRILFDNFLYTPGSSK
jgi:hypothetical protein